MEQTTDPIPAATKPASAETQHKHLTTAISAVAMSAFGTFTLGVLFGAAWPAAVASCGLSLMGAAVAVFMLKGS